MSQNTPTCTEREDAVRAEALRVSLVFEKIVESEVLMKHLPEHIFNFELDESGAYKHAPTLMLWHFFQLGYATRLEKPIELPKEVNGTLIEHMPKGSGFKSGFDFLVRDLLTKGVNLV